MATLVMIPPQISLPTFNKYIVQQMEDMSLSDGVHVDIGGLQQQESHDEAFNHNTTGKTREAVVDLSSNMLSSPNGPNASESAPSIDAETSRVEFSDRNIGSEHPEEQNGASSDATLDPTCNENSATDFQEKLDFQLVSEPPELASAFPLIFEHSSTSSCVVQDQSNRPTTTIAAINQAKPMSPYMQCQDVHINSIQMNPHPERPEEVLNSTNLRSASFQSLKGEFYQHQEHHTVLTSTSQPQSQFLLNILASSRVPSQSGNFESKETGLSYQHQSSQVGEAPHQLELPKDVCQLPECVMSRAFASVQLEHLLARVKHEKTMSKAHAWEEGAKAKSFNRYTRDESKITMWENTMKAKAEACMRKAQENLDKQRAKHIEKMKNAVASAHCKAQEKRAAMEARRAEDIVKAEEIASRIRATGKMPHKCLCVPI